MSSKTHKNARDKISDFGRRLKETFNNSSNQSIAEKLKVSKPALTAYMQGRIPPSDKLIEIAKLTNCNLNWLLTGEGTKNNNPQIERPQGLILQGNKGAIGNSISAVLIAANLALRGYGVLIAADVIHSCSHLLLANRNSELATVRRVTDESYIPTRNKKLDFFVPSYWSKDFPEEITKRFDFDYSEINKRYQFVIFDVQRMEDPFTYPHYSQRPISYIEPSLRNAQVLMSYQTSNTFMESVESTLACVKRQQEIYPDAGFMGAFIIKRGRLTKTEKMNSIEEIKGLQKIIGSKLFKTDVEYHKELRSKYQDLERKLYSRKTKVFHNYSLLVDEIIEKLGTENITSKNLT